MNLKWVEKELSLESLTISNHIQVRVEINQARVNNFVEIFDDLPPIKVIHITGGNTFLHSYVLADGFHRCKAAVRLDKSLVKCLIADGTYEDAGKVALDENAVVGPLTFSKEDIRKATEKAIALYPNMPAQQMAKDILHKICSHDYVTKVRSGVTPSVSPSSTIKDITGRNQPMFKPRPILEESSQAETEGDWTVGRDPYYVEKIRTILRKKEAGERISEDDRNLLAEHNKIYGKERVPSEEQKDLTRITSGIRRIEPHHIEAEWKYSQLILWKVKGFMVNSIDILAGREMGIALAESSQGLELRIFTRQGADFYPTKAGILVSESDTIKLKRELEKFKIEV